MNRRHFLRSLALGTAALVLAFRPESKPANRPVEHLVGFKGASFLVAGYVLCPYIPLYTSRDISVADLASRPRRPSVHLPLGSGLHPAELKRQAKYGGYEKYL